MSIERLNAPEAALPSHRTKEPNERLVLPRVVSASSKVNGSDTGHRVWNQTIHHLFERRNEIRTSRVKQVGAGGTALLRPADVGAVTLRFAGGTATIALEKPPKPPQFNTTRIRQWSIRVRAFYAAETVLVWPSNVVPAHAYELDLPVDADPALVEAGVLPGAPGAAGTSDMFELVYDEQTGEWFVDWFVRGRPTRDPGAEPEEPTTDPNPPPGQTDPNTPPGDGTDPTDPTTGDSYTDPETGGPMTTEQMPTTDGDLIALHNGSLSYSLDGGATWRQLTGAPASPTSASVVKGQGVVVTTAGGEAFFSPDLQNWRAIPLTVSESISVGIENGDFETGDTTGWLDVGVDPVRVLDTTRPEQRPGSQYYLTRDWRLINPQPFKLKQTVAMPDGASGSTMTIQADGWAAPGSTGTLRVLTDPFVPAPRGFASVGNQSSPALVFNDWARDAGGNPLDLHMVSGNQLGFRFPPTRGPSGTRSFELRSGDDVYPGPFFLPILAQNTAGALSFRIREEDVLAIYSFPGGGGGVVPSASGGYYTFGAAAGEARIWGVFVATGAVSIEFLSGGIAIFVTPPAEGMTIPPQEFEATTNGQRRWEDLSVEFFATGSEFTIELEGSGIPTDVFFDNVRSNIAVERTEQARAVASDYGQRRHVLASNKSVYALTGGTPSLIAAAPIDAAHVAAHGSLIALARGNEVVTSWDNGESWEPVWTASADIVQLHASSDGLLAVLSNGAIQRIGSGGFGALSTGLPSGSRLAYDRRRQQYIATAPSGQVWVWTPTLIPATPQPVNSTARTRRTLPMDIGRLVGFQEGVRDLFYTEQPTQQWKLAPSLAAPILHLLEVR